MRQPAAIIVPVYEYPLRTGDQISLRHLREHLGHYTKVIIAPGGLKLDGFDDFSVVRFSPRFFSSVAGYNRLMLSRQFYLAFREFEFLLIYQLDALVFRDELSFWCEKDYDFIGAPVFSQVAGEEGLFLALNGGFSLRRTAAFLKVLTHRNCGQIDSACRGTPFLERNFLTRGFKRALLTLHLSGIANFIPWLLANSDYNEDLFWSHYASLLDPSFRVAPMEAASRFAFEQYPERLFESIGGSLPFGCHAWRRWNPEFWKAFLPSE